MADMNAGQMDTDGTNEHTPQGREAAQVSLPTDAIAAATGVTRAEALADSVFENDPGIGTGLPSAASRP